MKQKYDPTNLFRFEQSLPPFPDGTGITRSTATSPFSDPDIQYLR